MTRSKLEAPARRNGPEEEGWIRGTYFMYRTNPNGEFVPFPCRLDLNTIEEVDYKDLRAARLTRPTAAEEMSFQADRLHDEIVVVFGSELTPQMAVNSLEALIDVIQRYGLLVGRAGPYGKFIKETWTGEIIA